MNLILKWFYWAQYVFIYCLHLTTQRLHVKSPIFISLWNVGRIGDPGQAPPHGTGYGSWRMPSCLDEASLLLFSTVCTCRGSHIHSAWIGLPVSGPWSIVPVFVFSVFVFYKKSGKFCSSLLCSVLDSVVAYYCLQMYNALFPDDKDEILLRTIKTKT